MVREKATITLDRQKAARATSLVGASSMSQAIDIALDRLIRSETLRSDIAAYARQPQTDDELAISDLAVEFDLDDAEIDYEALYGAGD